MSVAHVQSKGGNDGENGASGVPVSTLALTWNSNTTTGNFGYFWVWASHYLPDEVASWTVTDSQTNTWTRQAQHFETTWVASTPTGSCAALYVCTSLTGGTTPTVTWTGGTAHSHVRALMGEYSGSNISLLEANPDLWPSAGYAVAPGFRLQRPVEAKPGDMVICCVQDIPGTITYSAGTGYTSRATAGVAGDAIAQDKAITGHVRRREAPNVGQDVAANSFGMVFVLGEAKNLFAKVSA